MERKYKTNEVMEGSGEFLRIGKTLSDDNKSQLLLYLNVFDGKRYIIGDRFSKNGILSDEDFSKAELDRVRECWDTFFDDSSLCYYLDVTISGRLSFDWAFNLHQNHGIFRELAYEGLGLSDKAIMVAELHYMHYNEEHRRKSRASSYKKFKVHLGSWDKDK